MNGKLSVSFVEWLQGYPIGWTFFTEETMGRKAKEVPEKFCATCGSKLERKKSGKRLEDFSAFLKRLYCDVKCMAKGMEKECPTYSALLKRAGKIELKPNCEKCGTAEDLQHHHGDKNPGEQCTGQHSDPLLQLSHETPLERGKGVEIEINLEVKERVDRLSGLGNAIVPVLGCWIGKVIMKFEEERRNGKN